MLSVEESMQHFFLLCFLLESTTPVNWHSILATVHAISQLEPKGGEKKKMIIKTTKKQWIQTILAGWEKKNILDSAWFFLLDDL